MNYAIKHSKIYSHKSREASPTETHVVDYFTPREISLEMRISSHENIGPVVENMAFDTRDVDFGMAVLGIGDGMG